MRYLLSLPIHLYRFCIRPFIGPCCRFYPSCSTYALEALEKKGALRGSWAIIKRLVKCGPWHPGGHDPVD